MNKFYKSDDDHVRIMSYNVQCIPSFLVPNTNLRSRRKVIPEFVKNLVDKYKVNILILQELFDNMLFHEIKTCLSVALPYTTGVLGRKHEFPNWDSSLNRSDMPFHFLDGGVCIFSKYNIVNKHQMIFKNCRNTCALGAKGACLAIVEKGGKRMNVVGTHLQAFDGPSMEVRKRQYLELLNWLDDLFNKRIHSEHKYTVSKEIPFVMAGDFNTCCVNHKPDFDSMFSQSKLNDFVRFEHTIREESQSPTYSTYTNDYCKLMNDEDYAHFYDYILTGPGVKVIQPQTVVMDKLNSPVPVRRFYLHCLGLSKKDVYNASDHFPIYSVLAF